MVFLCQILKKWRENIGYVGQDSILLDDTILNNITFRDENISVKKIDEAIKLSNLEDILKIPLRDCQQLLEKEVLIYLAVKSKE